nr:DNA mismatch repair endonuclease MutL [Saprospiraceae bacterium]
MSNVIKLLPDHVANQIAAGEVIQRPASVVKELMENAIDADAKKIQLILKDSGKMLIRVVDNGKGMNPEDSRLAFERHATSKISRGEDLFFIKTMGFRGEALASIAAVARVEMISKMPGAELGTRILIEGSEVTLQEPHATVEGTSIAVKNLFFNVPARRKFLKSDKVELRRIIQEFERIALGFPEISFSLFNDDKELMRLPAATLKDRILAVFGKNLNDKLFPFNEETDYLKLTGFGVKPQFCKKSRKEQFFFLNKRFFKSGYLHHAVKGAYEGLLQPDEQPSYFIYLEMDPTLVDVNVHPTKQEIKFQDERMMYNMLRVTVRHGLGKHQLTPTLDFDSDRGHQILSSGSPQRDSDQTGGRTSSFSPKQPEKRDSDNWAEIFEGVRKEMSTSNLPEQFTIDGKSQERPYGKYFQLFNRFIAVQTKMGLLIIDQRKAHQNMLYRHLLKSLESDSGNTQTLLFPQSMEIPASEVPILDELLPTLQKTGLQIEHFGGNTFVIHGTPAIWTEDIEPDEMLSHLLENYRLSGDVKNLNKRISASMARSFGITERKTLSEEELKTLIEQALNEEPESDALHLNSSVVVNAEGMMKLFKK